MLPLIYKLRKYETQIIALSVFIMFLFKLSFGIYPFLDDYIQFKGYLMYDSPIKDVYIKMGLFSTRPLASLMDILFVGRFYDMLYLPYFIITLMHFSGVLMMRSNLRKIDIETSWAFVILCLFNPILAESSYWLSASVRIIPAFFLSQAGVFILSHNRYKSSFAEVFLFGLLNLLSFGFYEQLAVFSFFWTILFCTKLNKTKELTACIINCAIILFYYLAFKGTGVYPQRSDIGFGGFNKLISDITVCITQAVRCNFFSFFSHYPSLFAIICPLICILGLRAKNILNNYLKLYLALAIFLISFLPFLVLKNYFITFRNLFLGCISFALIVDWVLGKIKKPALLYSLVCFFTFFSWSNEMTDYKNVYQADAKIISSISHILTEGQKKSSDIKICITGSKKCYVPIKVLYGEHILNVTSSDWAMTGALRAEFENIKLPYVTLLDNPDLNNFNVVIDIKNPDNINITKNDIAK